MSYETPLGTRALSGVEARLIGDMAWQLTDSINAAATVEGGLEFGIVLFDRMDWRQQVVMLDRVLEALLDKSVQPPQRTALLDATIAAIYAQLRESLDAEIDNQRIAEEDNEGPDDNDTELRIKVHEALMEHDPNWNWPHPECAVMETWHLATESLQDRILADEDYQMDGLTMDLPPAEAEALKQTMGIHGDYFIDVPPDATDRQAREAWANIVERVSGIRPDPNLFCR